MTFEEPATDDSVATAHAKNLRDIALMMSDIAPLVVAYGNAGAAMAFGTVLHGSDEADYDRLRLSFLLGSALVALTTAAKTGGRQWTGK